MARLREILLPWNTQPPSGTGIDWSNSLCRDLLISLPFSSGDFRSLGTKQIQGIPTAASVGITPFGEALKLSATGHVALGTASLLPTLTTPFTMALYELPGTTSEFSSLVGLAGDARQWLWIRGTNAAYVCAIGRAESSVIQNFTSVGAQVAGVGRRFLLTSSLGTSGSSVYRLWMDGVEQTSTSTTTFGIVASGTNYIGWDGADTKFDGKLQDFNLWGRILSDGEIAEYFRNHRQVFEPQRISIPVPVAAGGAPTLSLPTYLAGSLTSNGFRPRVTAT